MSKIVTEGRHRIADILFGSQAVDGTLYLGIFTNTSEPGLANVLADITEPSGSGYSRIALTRGSWSVVANAAAYAEQTFAASGGNWGNCYGYFIASSADSSGKLIAVEAFSDGPYDTLDTYQIKVTPNITVTS